MSQSPMCLPSKSTMIAFGKARGRCSHLHSAVSLGLHLFGPTGCAVCCSFQVKWCPAESLLATMPPLNQDDSFGKHFFWTSLHFFWTWALLLDLSTILLEMATLLLDLHTLLLDLILPSCSTWPFPKPYPFWIDSPVSVQPRLHRNFSDSRALELH